MNLSFNPRSDEEAASDYHAGDFQNGPAQEAGFSLPQWLQYPKPHLALPEIPTAETFGDLLANRMPGTRNRLTPRTNRKRREERAGRVTWVANRIIASDLTISPRKEISLVALFGEDRRIATAFETSVQEGIKFASQFADTRVRRNKANRDRATGHVVSLIIYHIESREGDCQIHAHVLFFNVTCDPLEKRFKARFKALKIDRIVAHKGVIAKWIDARFTFELARLGYLFARDSEKGLILDGIPRAAIEVFSKGAQRIARKVKEQEARANRSLSAAERKNVGLSSRPPKVPLTFEELKARWLEDGRPFLLPILRARTEAEARALLASPSFVSPPHLEGAVVDGHLDRLFERHTTVATTKLIRSVLTEAQGEWHGEHIDALITERYNDGRYEIHRGAITTAAARYDTETLERRLYDACFRFKRPGKADTTANPFSSLLKSKAPLAVLIAEEFSKESVRYLADKVPAVKVGYALPSAAPSHDDALNFDIVEESWRKFDVVAVGQATTMTRKELRAILSLIEDHTTRVFLVVSKSDLRPRLHQPLVAALSRHRWMPKFYRASSLDKSVAKTSRSAKLTGRTKVRPKLIRAIADAVKLALHHLEQRQPIRIITATQKLARRLNSAIEQQLAMSGKERAIRIYLPKRPSEPALGDCAVSLRVTRHFVAGELLRVTGLDGNVIIEREDGSRKTVTRKVWSRLSPAAIATAKIAPLSMIELTAPVPGQGRQLPQGKLVQVLDLQPSGDLLVTGGLRIPRTFGFFRASCSRAVSELPKAAFTGKSMVVLRKAPSRKLRTLIRKLSRDKRLLYRSVKRSTDLEDAFFKAARSKIVLQKWQKTAQRRFTNVLTIESVPPRPDPSTPSIANQLPEK